MHGVARSVFNARKVAVEFLGADAFPDHVKEFAVVLRRSHLAVPTSVDVGDVENGDRPLHVIHHFEHFLEAAPQFLSAGGFDTDFGRGAVFDPGEHGEFILVVVPDLVDAVNDA